jgi:NitT/TauT family transport system ATP-binding protein
MDEPFGALDQPLREALQDQLRDIWDDLGKTIVFITHDVEEAVYLSERVLIMTRHPGTKKTVTEVGLDRSGTREDIVTSDAFADYKNSVWKSLHEETQTEVKL